MRNAGPAQYAVKKRESTAMGAIRQQHPATAAGASTLVGGARRIDVNPVVDITTGESDTDERAARPGCPRGRRKSPPLDKSRFSPGMGMFRRCGKVSLFGRQPTPRDSRCMALKLLKTSSRKKRSIWQSAGKAAARSGVAVASLAGVSILACGCRPAARRIVMAQTNHPIL